MKTSWMRNGALCIVLVIVMIATMPQHHDNVDLSDDLDKPSVWAYIQGWDDYDSMYTLALTNYPTIRNYVLKNSSKYMDSLASKGRLTEDFSILYVDYLDPTERFSGYNISDATIYRVDGSSFILPLDPAYTENVKYTVNVAVVLWNLDQNVKRHRFARNINTDIWSTNRGPIDFRAYYHAYMDALDESERITAWHIFESRRCAYDVNLPKITSLKVEGTNLVLKATDNVGIALVEWYVGKVNPESKPHKSVSYSSPSVDTSLDDTSLDLLTLDRPSGQTVPITCRVYDFEGMESWTGDGSRPREKRFEERKMKVKVP